MNLVFDASVALKWFFRGRPDEPDVDLALDLLGAVASGDITLFQPPHFLAEMSAVLAREAPDHAARDLRDLLDISIRTRDDTAVYARAMKLAIDLNHHLFDTLYHAVAIETPDTALVTADRRYFDKARAVGRVHLLADSAGLLTDGT